MGQFFRTATPPGDWRSFKFTNALVPALTMIEGSIYQIRDTVGILFLDAQYDANGCKLPAEIGSGKEGVLVYHIEKVMVDKGACAFTPGDSVYWPGIQGSAVTNVYSSGAIWIGICVWPAATGDDQVMIDMKGEVALWMPTAA